MKDDIRIVLICHSSGCISSGAVEIKDIITSEIKKLNLKKIKVKTTGCHGFCQRGPIVIIEPDGIFYSQVKAEDGPEIVKSHLQKNKPVERLFYKDPMTGQPIPHYKDIPFYNKQKRIIILRNCGHIDPEDIEDYIKTEGYESLKKVLIKMTPKTVIEEIKKSGLRGRGGAGFPTGIKWEFCFNSQETPKYMICNADEGDPGAFMDRSILEADPHSVIEGLIIGGYAIGANEGYIYVRTEYPLAVKRIRKAIKQAEENKFLGEKILDTDFNFNIKIMEGAGAFVCGEETALIASIEGKSGRPRPKPPFPAQYGLWGKPTTINNVKTLASIPVIILKSADWYSKIGTKDCKGTAVFAITGNIANCGLLEVAMGTTLRDIIYNIGGGIPGNKKFKAVQTGGPSGGCLPESFLDFHVDFQSLAKAGSIMGSGGMVVMDQDTCMVDIAKYFLDFTQRESCGECIPCRLGTKQLLDILQDITKGKGKEEDIDLLIELSEGIKKGSLCGLGQTAPNPVLTTIKYFRDEYEAHIKYKKCDAAACKELISSPCQHTCPIGTEAQVYISLLAEKRFNEAFDIILKDNPLPSVCARVCHHPCESKCQAGKWGDPIAIRALKRFANDYAIKAGIYPTSKKENPKGEKVAIIGSGPAGLTAGYFLAKKGYDPTIFEALPIPGGAMAVCIPEYRLPRDVLDMDIENIKNSGVKIKTNTRIGKDIPFKKITDEYKAVFIATGAHRSRKLDIPNEKANGVIDAMEFLKDINLKKKVNIGKTVGIIGGGNAAVDTARAVVRIKNCEKVIIIYRRTKAEMPAFKEEIEACIQEGVEFQFLSSPLKVITAKEKVTGVKCIKMKLGAPDKSGRRTPVPVKGSEFVIDLDTLIIAIGETTDLSFLNKESNIDISKRGTITVNNETFATKVKGVFAGGDVVTGPATVIEAMSSGKIAAEMIDKYLEGEKVEREYNLTRPSIYIPPVELTEEEIEDSARPQMPDLPINKRKNSFDEVDLG